MEGFVRSDPEVDSEFAEKQQDQFRYARTVNNIPLPTDVDDTRDGYWAYAVHAYELSSKISQFQVNGAEVFRFRTCYFDPIEVGDVITVFCEELLCPKECLVTGLRESTSDLTLEVRCIG